MDMTIVVAFIAALNQWGHDVDQRQLVCVAENVYHEARSEPIRGQIAAANVVMNRVVHKRYPTTHCKVIHQKDQFSWHKPGPHSKIRDNKAWYIAVEIAGLVLAGLIADQTSGATHYYNPQKARPFWRAHYPLVTAIGRHQFHKRPT